MKTEAALKFALKNLYVVFDSHPPDAVKIGAQIRALEWVLDDSPESDRRVNELAFRAEQIKERKRK